MNERNVAALENLLREHCRLAHCQECDCVESAAFLAAHGVLVASALSDEEAVRIGADAAGNLPSDRSEIALCVRGGLERIATGQPG